MFLNDNQYFLCIFISGENANWDRYATPPCKSLHKKKLIIFFFFFILDVYYFKKVTKNVFFYKYFYTRVFRG